MKGSVSPWAVIAGYCILVLFLAYLFLFLTLDWSNFVDEALGHPSKSAVAGLLIFGGPLAVTSLIYAAVRFWRPDRVNVAFVVIIASALPSALLALTLACFEMSGAVP